MAFITSVFIVIFGCLFVHEVQAHGNGAPSSRCDSMLPGHWVNPQESLSPFQVILDKSVITPGDRVNITLSTVRGQPGFKGFLVMVKDSENGMNYGKFDLAISDIKRSMPVDCFEVKDSAMTHVMNDVKKSVQLFWIAPKLEEKMGSGPPMEKELRVVATFVKDFWTIWTNVEPVGGTGLLLQPTPHHPKFQHSIPPTPTANVQNQMLLRGDATLPGHGHGNIQLDGGSSWEFFMRMWNYLLQVIR